MKEESLHSWMEPELEARIVALVLGEASDFEAEELERLIEQKPEAAAFKQRMEVLHGMLRSDADREEFPEGEWKLSAEKREEVLAVLDGAANKATKEPGKKPADRSKRRLLPALLKVAAVVALVSAFLGVLMPASITHRAGMPGDLEERMVAEKEVTDLASVTMSSLDVDSVDFLATDGAVADDRLSGEKVNRDRVYAQIGHGGSSSDIKVTAGRDFTSESERVVGSGGEIRVDQVRDSRLSLSSSSPKAAPSEALAQSESGQSSRGGEDGVERTESVNWSNSRASFGAFAGGDIIVESGVRTTGEGSIDQLGRLADSGPVSNKPDESNANSLGKLAEAKSSGGDRFAYRMGASDLDFPGQSGEVTTRGSKRPARQPEGEISAGFMTDYVFGGAGVPRQTAAVEKQHGGTVDIDDHESTNSSRFHIGATATFGDELDVKDTDVMHGGVSLSVSGTDWGESESGEVNAVDATGVGGPGRVFGSGGTISIKGNSKTQDKVVRRELSLVAPGKTPALRSASVSPDSKDDALSLNFRFGRSLQRQIPPTLDELSAKEEPFSTFSLHVSDVSFKLAQAALAKGEWPEVEKIRIEEFVNAFDYGDAMPAQEEKVAAALEQAVHPFLQQRNLLRVSMRTAAAGRNSSTPLRLTFLLDNSGSMERVDRRETVQRAFLMLASMLQPDDQVTLISFARQPRLLADRVSGADANRLVETVRQLPSEGGTNLEAALNLAFEKAKEQQTPGAQNRIILLTDGAANLGDAEPGHLAEKVETMRNEGIAFDAAGIGTEGLNDTILEALTRKGDGRYYLLDSVKDVDAGFANQIAGALRPAAGNVKVQIEFNPERVGNYKLLGFEKHRLRKEEFRDDKVDAAELAAAEAGVAVYQIETKPDGTGDIGSAFVRFRDMASGEMTERRWTIPYQSHPARPDQATPSMQLATVASLFGARLKGDALGDVVRIDELQKIVSAMPEAWQKKSRVDELKTMLESAREIAGE